MSFRTRLTLTMLATFLLAGTALVWVMNALVQVTVAANSVVDASDVQPERYEVIDGELVPVAVREIQGQQVGVFGPDQLHQLMWWSLLVIVLFGLVAWALSRWLTNRALTGIRHVTQTTRRINEHDLSQRLALTGSEDEITELADTIDGMLARLEQAFDAQSRFAANASHELRTPLTVTQTSLEIPLEQGLISDEARPDVERALAAAKQSEELIAALLALADSRHIGPGERCPCDVAELLESRIEDIKEQAALAGIELVATIPPSMVAEVHPLLLRRAIDNLLNNAVSYNHPGGNVDVFLKSHDHAIQFVIANTGETLDPDRVPELVEPFNRGSRGRSSNANGQRGYGLGLAIVDAIASAHGGALSLHGRDGGGLIAILELPTTNQVTDH